MARVFHTMDGNDDDGLGRPLLAAGVLVVVLVWFGLSWQGALARGLLNPVLSEGNQTASAVLLLAGLVGGLGAVALSLGAIRRYRRMAVELRLRRVELDQSRDRLRRYVADLERISEVATHDLQEPLRRMVTYSQLLAQHDQARMDDEMRGYVSHVVDGARRMKELVGGLNAFVSVDSLPCTSEVVAATEAVTVARDRMATALAASGAALVVDPLPVVVADYGSLVEIFAQLIDNAIRFRSPGRRPVIHVSSCRQGGLIAFMVRDNGIGIEPSRVARMFEIFHRSSGTGTRSATGIGMGLAVVRRLVERMGGGVWAESKEGQGSVFGFTLPAEPSSLGEGRNPGQEAKAA